MKFRPGIADLPPYPQVETRGKIKLDANERAWNLPDSVRQSVAEQLQNIHFNRYPDSGEQKLRELIAADLGLEPTNVLVGNGSSELLAALCHVFGGPGRKIVFPQPSFSMYQTYIQMADSSPIPVQLAPDWSLAPTAVVAAACQNEASLIILCNPNNPTGNVMPLTAIADIVANTVCPVVIDEAYVEFYGESALTILANNPRVIVVRTFSKAYGLAAARVGYLLAAADVCREIAKVLLPYHVNALSLTAAAIVYEQRAVFRSSIAATIAERERVAAALAKLPGIEVYDSKTNFVLFKTAAAEKLTAYLAGESIDVRTFGANASLADCIRFSMGTAAENTTFLQAVKAFLNNFQEGEA